MFQNKRRRIHLSQKLTLFRAVLIVARLAI
jgi:hypothetical protein